MLDAAFVRDHLDRVRGALVNRGLEAGAELGALAELDTSRRRLIPELENLRRQQNASGEEVARAKREGRDASDTFAASKARAQLIKDLESQLVSIEERRNAVLYTIPNLPHESVPVGRSAADNCEVRRHGDPPSFPFTPKAHW